MHIWPIVTYGARAMRGLRAWITLDKVLEFMEQFFRGNARHVFERARITDRNSRRTDAPDRNAEFFRDRGRDLGTESGRLYCFVRDQHPPGARSRRRRGCVPPVR